MAIIRHEADLLTTSFYYNEYPNHFVSESEKQSKKYIKKTLDYYSTIAFQQYNENDERFSKNYKILKGILDKSDFYEEALKEDNTEMRSFMDDVMRSEDLPQYVKHYPIMNPPINSMVGELSARTDNIRIKAFDDDSKSEELLEKTSFLQQVIQSKIQQRIAEDLESQGMGGSPEFDEYLANMTTEQVGEYMTSYTSLAERWANHVLSALKIRFNMKEKSEDAFRDLLVTSREFYHIFEDKSDVGFNVETINPKNVWYLTTPDQKYIRNAYAAGTIEVMELSEILDKFELSEEEIEYLNSQAKGFYLEGMGVRQSNLLNNKTGEDSFTYDTYDPLVAKYKLFAESKLMAEAQLNTFLGITQAGYATYGSKFVVVQSYYRSKKKVGLLHFMNPLTQKPDTKFVDDTYRKIPEEIDIQWQWIDEWRKGVKIGPHVYIESRPLKSIDYCPILGVIHEAKNTPAKSLVDLMKPYQVLYNVCMNQIFQLLKKDLGIQIMLSMRYIPKAKDGDYQDAIDQWMTAAREEGTMFMDDSPENVKGGGSFAQTGTQNLSRAPEMQARYELANAIKMECWQLTGFSPERLGAVSAPSQAATTTNSQLARSFTQTENWFVQHEYVLTQVYQAIVDMAQYVEGRKPTSTISYITNEGENAFIQVNGPDIKLRNYHVYASNTQEDQRLFNELRQLAQPMLQNGASPYEIAALYSTNSIRQMKDMFKRVRDKQEQMQQQQVDLQQQELAQQQEQFQATMAQADLIRREDMMNDNYQNELNRINDKEIAIIKTFTLQKDNLKDTDASGVPDLLEVSNFALETQAAQDAFSESMAKVNIEREKLVQSRSLEMEKIKLEKEKMQLERDKMKNDLQIAKYKDKGTFKKSK